MKKKIARAEQRRVCSSLVYQQSKNKIPRAIFFEEWIVAIIIVVALIRSIQYPRHLGVRLKMSDVQEIVMWPLISVTLHQLQVTTDHLLHPCLDLPVVIFLSISKPFLFK